ncbi:MAG TPA: hypothetical protein VK118_06300 [Tetragenococcus sp.]|nr:hypothetical protein [Tetragenococcus sp.]
MNMVLKKNAEDHHYKISVTAAESLKILGEESTIRILHYFILKSSFDSLERLNAWQQILKLTEKIFAYLKISVIKTQVRQIIF